MRPRWRTVARLLIASFLLQPVLTYLVSPMVVHDATGRTVVLCTLQGSKWVTLDLPAPAHAGGAEHCPALTLFQIAGAAAMAQPLPTPTPLIYTVVVQDARAAHQHDTRYPPPYTTRAPPVV